MTVTRPSTSKRSTRGPRRGLSIVEVMISLTISSIDIAGFLLCQE